MHEITHFCADTYPTSCGRNWVLRYVYVICTAPKYAYVLQKSAAEMAGSECEGACERTGSRTHALGRGEVVSGYAYGKCRCPGHMCIQST